MQLELDSAPSFTSNKRYVIERELGHGGMGVVYQALDLERNTRVALKALTQRDALNIYRLKNEFRQLADLSHPNLVALHELCNEGAAWFFTMELVNGKTFDDYVASDRSSWPVPQAPGSGRLLRDASITLSQRAIASEFPLPRATCNIKRLRQALRQLVEAVAALHDAGKLHRDLKPSNVLVTPEGRVVVLDFGLVSNSTFVDPEAQDAERTVGGCVFGTPAYMSPEQAVGEAITTASDWYAVGTMLYEALTGQLPFDGTVLEILRQKEDGEPPQASELVKGVPDDLDQLCRDLLQRDPEKRPSSAEILRAITGHSEPPIIFDAQASRTLRQHGELFIGRERHIEELRAAFEVAKAGKPTTVLVHGLSGMGKSALVRCFANDLIRDEEAVVLRGRCYERETVPYKAFDNIIDALSRYLMRLPVDEAAQMLPRNVHALTVLFPVLKRVKPIAYARRPKYQTADARELRNQAFAALKDLLLRITDHHPLVINIDDLQWADMDSARLLSFIMGPPDPPPLLLIGSYRRDEADNSPFLKQILSERNLNEGAAEVREVRVDALPEAEAQQLAAALLRDLPAINTLFSSSIAAEADGVPFFIAELAQHLRAHAERGDLPVSMKPISLEQVILERVAGMPANARRLLQILSVAAGPIEQGIAIDAAGLPHGDRAAMLALRAARLIRTRGTRQADKAETYHDRVRETVVGDMNAEAIKRAHASIAHAMERYDIVDPERMVVHYSGAGDGMRAGETAVQAAHAAAKKLAFNRAAELYARAIELLPDTGRITQRDLYKYLGDALANAGRGARSAEAYLNAARDAEPAEARKMQRLAAQQYLRSGRTDAGRELTEQLLDQVRLSFPRSEAAAIRDFVINRGLLTVSPLRPPRKKAALDATDLERLETLGSIFQELSLSDPLLGALFHTQYLRLARKSSDTAHLVRALAWEVVHLSALGNHQRAARILAYLDEVSHADSDPYRAGMRDMANSAFCFFSGRYSEALAPARAAEDVFRSCNGTYWEYGWVALLRYAALEFTGDLSELAREAPARARHAAERDDHVGLGLLTLSLANTYLMADDPESAARFLDEQWHRLGDGFNTFHHHVVHRRTDALLYTSRGVEALEYVNSHWPRIAASYPYRGRLMKAASHCMRARCAIAAYRETSQPQHRAIAERDLKILERLQTGYGGFALALRGTLHSYDGDLGKAMECMKQATAAFTNDGVHRGQIYASRRTGEILGSSPGTELTTQADLQLKKQGISQPAKWITIHLGALGRD